MGINLYIHQKYFISFKKLFNKKIFFNSAVFFLFICISCFVSCGSIKQAPISQPVEQYKTLPPLPGKPAKQEDNTEIIKKEIELKNLGIEISRPYGKNAIFIRYRADDNLNIYEDTPHTLLLMVYQLKSLNTFKELAKDRAGLSRILNEERFDETVLATTRIFVQPGETNVMELDRLENVRWVTVVAGYFDLIPEQAYKFYIIPINVEKTGVYGFRKTKVTLERLIIDLYLGQNSIQEVSNQ